MLSCQFQKLVVAVGIVDASHMLFAAVIVCGSLLQLLGHFHPSDEHRTITASNAMLYSCRTHVCGHQEDRVIVRYRDTFGDRRPPSSQALVSDHPDKGRESVRRQNIFDAKDTKVVFLFSQ